MENGFAHSIYKIKNQKNSSPKTSIFDIKVVDPVDPTNPSDPFDIVDFMCPFDLIRFTEQEEINDNWSFIWFKQQSWLEPFETYPLNSKLICESYYLKHESKIKFLT